ncbi:MAG: type II toxin-antitoxin system VapC family toxin [Candidatus Hydrothermarchaeota archaeon]
MRVLLDTNALIDRSFVRELDTYRDKLEIFISSITYLEFMIKAYRRGRDAEARSLIRASGIKVCDFDKVSAELCALETHMLLDFKKKARDYMMGAVAKTNNCKLITYNKKDFTWMKEDVLEPEELLKLLR